MSEVYVHEPPLKGKVVLHTSHGDLDVELWSRECPKACRNFVQLCLEGYYNETIFHRVIKDFLVQGGDPTGTGKGGDSIYDEPFPNEIHSRLQFRYRGLVGVANVEGEQATNGSQFFITLGRTDFLNTKHTLFGKLTGNTIYNLLNLSDVETDASDRPLQPPILKYAEVLWNPYDDIHPRLPLIETTKKDDDEVLPEKRVQLASKKTQLLSFGETQSDEEGEDEIVETYHSQRIKSAHDVLDDSRLLKNDGNISLKVSSSDKGNDMQIEKEKLKAMIASKSFKSDIQQEEKVIISEDEEDSNDTLVASSTLPKHPQSVSKEKKRSKMESLSLKSGMGSLAKFKQREEGLENADLLSEKEKQYQHFLQKKRNTPQRKRERDEGFLPNLDEIVEESDGSWLHGKGLKFAVDSNRAYELDAARESLAVYDPLSGKDAEESMKFRRQQQAKPSLHRDKAIKKW
ncbi:peptidyl-prolyl cis-trans isomerase [Cardiosporidium cionae]|uniref:Peptidyl-prolyl cis-trans isomerase n=1 Tax=Cardiosporidium cionae TaxID=476202 RepID=A0ABQ7J730_9APIC|nr:peptidyl-prolyl cis-trans isomerase [Cardiosporidium cionae]|eukprot:KAF8819797.1 peptidyl-prolyl cis-trans isomerase [Cardiosporidium cionae]